MISIGARKPKIVFFFCAPLTDQFSFSFVAGVFCCARFIAACVSIASPQPDNIRVRHTFAVCIRICDPQPADDELANLIARRIYCSRLIACSRFYAGVERKRAIVLRHSNFLVVHFSRVFITFTFCRQRFSLSTF